MPQHFCLLQEAVLGIGHALSQPAEVLEVLILLFRLLGFGNILPFPSCRG